MRETIRVYAFARDLDAEPARLLALCRQAGIPARNVLSSLTPAQQRSIMRLLEGKGPEGGAAKLAPIRPRPSVGHGK
jgi:hypothetical protein